MPAATKTATAKTAVAKKPSTQKPPAPKNVHEAMLRVMGQVGYVLKQKSPKLSYTYAGEAALIKAIRPHMVDNGLVIYPTDAELVDHEIYTTAKGTLMNRSLIRTTYQIVHATSGSSIDVVVLGEGTDAGDKGIAKAMTGGMKYVLRQAFLIETGDDPDQQPSNDQQRAGKAAAEKGPNGERIDPDKIASGTAVGIYQELEKQAFDLGIQVTKVKFPAKLVDLKKAWRLLNDQVIAVQQEQEPA